MTCWRIGKTSYKEKTPLVEFKVTTPKNLLINNQAVASIRNLTTTPAYPKLPTYTWTFAPIPNWTWSCSRLLSFQISNLWLTPLDGSQYVTNSYNLKDCCWLQSSSLHKWWRSGSTCLRNPMAHKHNSFSHSIWVLGFMFRCVMTFKISLIYARVISRETIIIQIIMG